MVGFQSGNIDTVTQAIFQSAQLIPRLPSVSRAISCYTAVSPGSRRPSRGSRLTLVPGTRYLCIFPGAKIYTVSSTWWRRVYFLNSSFPGLYPRCTVQLVPATLAHRALSGCTWLPPEEEKPGTSHVLLTPLPPSACVNKTGGEGGHLIWCTQVSFV